METLEGFVKDASIDASMAVSLQDSLNNCNTAVARIQQEMEPFVKVSSKNGMAKQRRLSWSFNEIKVIEIRGHLQHGKANLNLSEARCHDLVVTEVLPVLNTGADLGVLTSRDARTYPDAAGAGCTALRIAAGAIDTDIMGLLIARGTGVNARDCTGANALHALDAHPPGISRVLLDAGADVNSGKHDGRNLPFWASRYSDYALVRFLLDHTAMRVESATLDGWGPIHEAATWGNLQILGCLLEHGVDVNDLNLSGQTPLHETVRHRHFEAAKVLVQQGAVSCPDHTGETPLMIAQRTQQDDVARFLTELEAGQGGK